MVNGVVFQDRFYCTKLICQSAHVRINAYPCVDLFKLITPGIISVDEFGIKLT